MKVTSDLVFQRIFGKVGNENITKGLLEKILGIKIEELTLDTNKRLIGNNIDDKIGRIEKYHTKWEIRENDNSERKLTNDLEIHVLELSKYKDGDNNPEDNWIKFIKEGARMSKFGTEKIDKEIEEAIKELEILEKDPEMRDLYELKEMDLRDRVSYMKSALEEGKKEMKKKIVLNMYKENVTIENICKFTKMKKEEVERIINENKD